MAWRGTFPLIRHDERCTRKLTPRPAIPARRPQRQRRALLLARKGPQATQSPRPTRIGRRRRRQQQRHRNDHARHATAADERGGPVEARERRAAVRGLGARGPSELERGREAEEEVRELEDQEGWELNGGGVSVARALRIKRGKRKKEKKKNRASRSVRSQISC